MWSFGAMECLIAQRHFGVGFSVFSALKGPNSIAQGAALGTGANRDLKP
jgi:hypothetical protein